MEYRLSICSDQNLQNNRLLDGSGFVLADISFSKRQNSVADTRAFPGTVVSNNGDDFAGSGVQRYVLQSKLLSISGRHIFKFQRRSLFRPHAALPTEQCAADGYIEGQHGIRFFTVSPFYGGLIPSDFSFAIGRQIDFPPSI